MPTYREEDVKELSLEDKRAACLHCWGRDFGNCDKCALKGINRRTYEELESQLTAEREARQKAEAACAGHMEVGVRNARYILELEQRAESAEARIKASQEQEPAFVIHDELGNTHNLYKQPPIPPEVTELQRTTESLTDMLTDAWEELKLIRAALGVEYEPHQSLFDRTLEACRSSAELTRKLAEQQAVVQQAIALMEPIKNYLPASHIQRWIACIQSPSDHFTKLIEEAKRQAVPEGWKLVPIDPSGAGMSQAGKQRADELYPMFDGKLFTNFGVIEIYKAMLSAAPQPHKD